jgi:hypothetical protein
MKARTICRRCHRLRPVNSAHYCGECCQALRKLESPKVHAAGELTRQVETLDNDWTQPLATGLVDDPPVGIPSPEYLA